MTVSACFDAYVQVCTCVHVCVPVYAWGWGKKGGGGDCRCTCSRAVISLSEFSWIITLPRHSASRFKAVMRWKQNNDLWRACQKLHTSPLYGVGWRGNFCLRNRQKLLPPCIHQGLIMSTNGSIVPEIKLGLTLRHLNSLNSDITCQHLHKDTAFYTKLASVPKTARIKIPLACLYCDTVQIIEICSISSACSVLWSCGHTSRATLFLLAFR